MIISTGIDIVDVSRIKKASSKWGTNFLNRIFTNKELNYSKKQASVYQHLAARFAAKEAVLKAFGEGYGKNIIWTDIEILNEKSGQPKVYLSGDLKKMQKQMRVGKIMISLSHTTAYAIASIILLSKS